MSFAPTIGNTIADSTKNIDFGYYWVIFSLFIQLQEAFYWALMALTGVATGFWLLYVDYAQGDGILSKVNTAERITELITSPSRE